MAWLSPPRQMNQEVDGLCDAATGQMVKGLMAAIAITAQARPTSLYSLTRDQHTSNFNSTSPPAPTVPAAGRGGWAVQCARGGPGGRRLSAWAKRAGIPEAKLPARAGSPAGRLRLPTHTPASRQLAGALRKGVVLVLVDLAKRVVDMAVAGLVRAHGQDQVCRRGRARRVVGEQVDEAARARARAQAASWSSRATRQPAMQAGNAPDPCTVEPSRAPSGRLPVNGLAGCTTERKPRAAGRARAADPAEHGPRGPRCRTTDPVGAGNPRQHSQVAAPAVGRPPSCPVQLQTGKTRVT